MSWALDNRPWERAAGWALCQFFRILTGVQSRWIASRPHPRPRIYFANHTSHLDTLLLWSSLPYELRRRTRPVAAEDYWTAGPFRRWLARRVFGAVLIPRAQPEGGPGGEGGGGVAGLRRSLRTLTGVLEDGASLILFPEGTRRDAEIPGAFRGGLDHLARRRPEVELIPAYVENLNRILPKGEFLPVPLIARVTFGPPLERRAGEPKHAFLERARRAVSDLGEPLDEGEEGC